MHPTILWAQSDVDVYLTIGVEALKIDSLDIDGDSFKFKGMKGDDVYEADLKLFAELKGSDRRQVNSDRRVELVIPKQNSDWWPRLLKGTTKVPWIKVDFDKWKDKEEKEDEEGGVDKLFQKIYKDADDDVRKAMMKSYSESCGTVLSTNWSDIKDRKTQVSPPDGMEYKKYDQ